MLKCVYAAVKQTWLNKEFFDLLSNILYILTQRRWKFRHFFPILKDTWLKCSCIKTNITIISVSTIMLFIQRCTTTCLWLQKVLRTTNMLLYVQFPSESVSLPHTQMLLITNSLKEHNLIVLNAVLSSCQLADRKGIWPVKFLPQQFTTVYWAQPE